MKKPDGKTQTPPDIGEIAIRIVEQSRDGIMLVDGAGKVLYMNAGMAELCGCAADEIPTIRVFGERFLADRADLDRVRLRMEAAVRKEEDVFEARTRYGSAAGRDVRIVCRSISMGGTRCTQIQVSDIAERKHIEVALRESEEMFRNLAEQSPNMIFIHNGRGIVYANRKCEEVMGYSCAELYLQEFNFLCLVDKKDQEQQLKAFSAHMACQEVPPIEYTLVTRGGKKIEAILATKLINHGGVSRAILGIVTDVSDLKRIEASLRQSEAELREQKRSLQEKNAALKEILANIESEKLQIGRQVSANVEKVVLPILLELKRTQGTRLGKQISLIETAMKDLTSKFGANISGGMAELSPQQIEICNMIKSGMTSKDIAEMMHISYRTVETQRNRIRKKLGVSRKAVNLTAFLQTLS